MFKNIEDLLDGSQSEYLSGCNEVSAIDFVLFSEVSTIVYMFSLKEKLNEE